MALDIYMTIPGISGESRTDVNLGNDPRDTPINVYSFSWGMSNPTTVGGSWQGTGKASFSDVSVQKLLDKSSPQLMQACVTGHRFPKMTLSFVKAINSNTSEVFLTYEFDTVLVSSVSDGANSGGDGSPSESISFVAGSAKVTYHMQNPNGSLAPPNIFSWNVVTNRVP
jgi:type VI secretion system secreted protein Hcp